MSYNYEDLKHYVLTDEGSADVISAKNFIDNALKQCGAVRCQEIMSGVKYKTCDSWEQLACIDRLVELKEIKEITAGMQVAGQYRIFTR